VLESKQAKEGLGERGLPDDKEDRPSNAERKRSFAKQKFFEGKEVFGEREKRGGANWGPT